MDRSEGDPELNTGDEGGGELWPVRERYREHFAWTEAAGAESGDELLGQPAGVYCRSTGGVEQVQPRDRFQSRAELRSQGRLEM